MYMYVIYDTLNNNNTSHYYNSQQYINVCQEKCELTMLLYNI